LNPKEQAVKYICDKLLEEGQITGAEYNNILSEYSDNDSISFTKKYQEEFTNSKDMNSMFLESGIDLYTLFNTLNDSDKSIKKFNTLNKSIINSVKLNTDKIEDELYIIRNKIIAENIYTYYENFRDKRSIDDKYEYSMIEANYDKYIEAIKLAQNNNINALLSKTGNRMGQIEVLNKYSSMYTTYKNNYNSIENVIDNSMDTYWHECLEVDSPIEIDYITDKTEINRGAVCELLITLPALTETNEIRLTPFCEFPLEIVEILYSNDDDNFVPLVFNINSEPQNKYLTNRFSLKTEMYQFESIQAKRFKIVLNQIHYAPNHFIDDSNNAMINGIFIKEDNEELIDRIMDPLNESIMNETFKVNLDRRISKINKLQYEYGIYNIEINNNDYYSKSEYVSNPYQFPGLSTIVLETNEEHFEIGLEDPKIFTSIEYQIILNNNEETYEYNILPYNKSKVDFELLNTVQETQSNRIYAYTRFDMKLEDINNDISIYKDNDKIETGFTINSKREIEFIEFDPFAKYSISYELDNIDKAKEIKLPTFTERIELIDVKLKAVLKQNSRIYTEVTPLLHNYIFYAIDVPVPVGEYNDLTELLIIPEKSYTNNPIDIPIIKSGEPVLLEIDILQDPLIISTVEEEGTGNLIPLDITEIDEYIE
jgi:hypothetical protein